MLKIIKETYKFNFKYNINTTSLKQITFFNASLPHNA